MKDYILKFGLILGSFSIVLLVISYTFGVDFFLMIPGQLLKAYYLIFY